MRSHKDYGLFLDVVKITQCLTTWSDAIAIASLHWKEFSKTLMASVDGLEQPSINIVDSGLWIMHYMEQKQIKDRRYLSCLVAL